MPRDAPRASAASCSSVAAVRVGLAARQREVTGAGIGVVDGVGQPGVQGLPFDRVEAGEHHGREQRVGEPHDEVVADDQQIVGDGSSHEVDRVGMRPTPRGDRLHAGRSERGGDAQHARACCRERRRRGSTTRRTGSAVPTP